MSTTLVFFAWMASGFNAKAHLCENRVLNGKQQARTLCGAKPAHLLPATGNKRCAACLMIEDRRSK
jgi:hypothetical protein